jgi:hypothetical protein
MNFLNVFKKRKYDDIRTYVSKKLGNIHLSIPSQINSELDIEVLIVEPAKNKPYYTLITSGLSQYEMKIPPFLESNSFCELVIYLPEDWKILNPNINHFWPINSLIELSRKIANNYGWVTFSSIMSLNQNVSDNCSFDSFLFISGVEDEAIIDSKYVSFFTLIPIYNEEALFGKQNTGDKLFSDLVDDGLVFPPVIDINRKNSKSGFY